MVIFSFTDANTQLYQQLNFSLDKLSFIPRQLMEEAIHFFEYFYNIPTLILNQGLDTCYYFPFLLLHWAIRVCIAFPLEILLDILNLLVALVEYFNQLLFLMLEMMPLACIACEELIFRFLHFHVEYMNINVVINSLSDNYRSFILGYCVSDSFDDYPITLAVMIAHIFLIPALILRDIGQGLQSSHIPTTKNYQPIGFFTQTENTCKSGFRHFGI